MSLIAMFVVVLGSAVSAQDGSATPDRDNIDVVEGTVFELRLDRDVVRTAIGDTERVELTTIDSRTLLVQGKQAGRTTVIVWTGDGSIRYTVRVRPDIEILELALAELDPRITVEIAPDRGAVVLRGVVTDLVARETALRIATQYLDGGSSRVEAAVISESGEPLVEDPTRVASANVIDLLRVETLPQPLEARIEAAIHDAGCLDVSVRRLSQAALPDDAEDAFVLDGTVPDQTKLQQCLQIASILITGRASRGEDVEVLGDESGGAFGNGLGIGGGGGQGIGGGGLGGGGGGFGGGLGGGGGGRVAQPQIERNIGRATALSVADGRVLSLLHVENLPQVRVAVRFFEIDRSELLQYSPDFAVINTDFPAGALEPSSTTTLLQGAGATQVGAVSPTDARNVFGFLADGFTQEFQIAGDRFAIDSVLQLLETRGIARSLSRPNLVVLSGERANFQVGGSIPVPENFAPALGNGSTGGVFNSVEFQPFGVGLQIRPLVEEDAQITLELQAQVSAPDAALTTVIADTTGAGPLTVAFARRSLATNTRLRTGDSLIISGLAQSRRDVSESRTPWLHKIPLLGRLFERFSATDDDLDLVVVVTPTIVRQPIDDLDLWVFPEFELPFSARDRAEGSSELSASSDSDSNDSKPDAT